MSRRRRRARIPAMLEALVEAVEQQQIDNAAGAARALRAFGELAAVELPARGVLGIDDRGDLSKAIQDIADEHLGFAPPRRRFFGGIETVAETELRLRIEDAAGELRAISDQAHFYLGLSFGVTLARFGWPS